MLISLMLGIVLNLIHLYNFCTIFNFQISGIMYILVWECNRRRLFIPPVFSSVNYLSLRRDAVGTILASRSIAQLSFATDTDKIRLPDIKLKFENSKVRILKKEKEKGSLFCPRKSITVMINLV